MSKWNGRTVYISTWRKLFKTSLWIDKFGVILLHSILDWIDQFIIQFYNVVRVLLIEYLLARLLINSQYIFRKAASKIFLFYFIKYVFFFVKFNTSNANICMPSTWCALLVDKYKDICSFRFKRFLTNHKKCVRLNRELNDKRYIYFAGRNKVIWKNRKVNLEFILEDECLRSQYISLQNIYKFIYYS